MTSSPWLRPIPLFVLLATALALGACGGDDGPAQDSAPKSSLRDGLVVGIGEQQTAMFALPRFKALGIDDARLVVAYDAASVDFERDLVTTWLSEAKRAGVRPFITFGHSRVRPKKLPSVSEYRRAFRAFRRLFPDVETYAPWNEINHNTQPTSKHPKRAAEYYNVVKDECSGCTVLAGDVLDQAGMTRYLAAYKRHLDGEPTVWGLHNYADSNRFRKSGLGDMLAAVSGDIWLTETGGIVKFGRSFPRDEKRAARAVTFALKLASDSPRVKRIYLYNWTGAKPGDRFDAGLVAPGGSPRPGYAALARALGT